MSARTGVFGMLSAVLLVTAMCGAAGPATASEPTPLPEVLELSPTHGPPAGGEVVTVHGSGFVGSEIWVFIDGLWLDPVVHSDTELTFVAPPHAVGSARVSVIVTESVGEGPFYVYDEPAAVPTPTATPTPTPERTGSVVLADPAPTPTSTPPASAPGTENPTPIRPDRPPTLARTGARTADLGSVALLLLVAGLVLVRLATPRRSAFTGAGIRRTR